MTTTGFKQALRRVRPGRSGVIELIGLSLFSAFLAATAAFDTEELSVLPRHIYWQCAVVGGGVIALVIEPWIARLTPGRPRLFLLAQMIAMTPPISLWVAVLPTLLWGVEFRAIRTVWTLPSVLTVNVAVIGLAWLVRAAFREARVAAPTGVAPGAIRCKLPPRLARARLLAVEAEDHYLRVRTEAGSDLVLMRFGDALEALGACDGFRTHRSWWVARTAVDPSDRTSSPRPPFQRAVSTAPVSRTYAAALQGADWAATVV